MDLPSALMVHSWLSSRRELTDSTPTRQDRMSVEPARTPPLGRPERNCLDVAGASSANGTAVQLYDCNGTAAQQWTVLPDGSVQALGACLDVTDDSSANSARAQIWSCTGAANQKWQLR
ncbi:ricin-type beta-trefoil lectin domain protein [Streptomyces sp. NPDC014983]|uniref:ricin-type beta-trefoil lectin domain protein n=1 Tax=Streptomyces sp. NPDC014983 TaxID=3364933 RepID=UPI0036FAF03A